MLRLFGPSKCASQGTLTSPRWGLDAVAHAHNTTQMHTLAGGGLPGTLINKKYKKLDTLRSEHFQQTLPFGAMSGGSDYQITYNE